MTFLPVVERELRVASRRPRLYWGRFIAASAAMALVVWVWLTIGSHVTADKWAQQIFGGLTTLAFIYSLLAGLILTADVISEEKREGTLGLLFLTDLKGYDVVFGKLFATSLNAFYGLLAVFPVMTIPLLLGSITLGDVGRMALVLVNTLWFSLSIGILVSSFSRHDRKSQIGAFLIVLFMTGGLALLVRMWGKWRATEMSLSFYASSPVFSFVHAFDKNYTAHNYEFWLSVGMIHALGWLAFLGASIVVRHTWQDKPRVGAALRWEERWRLWKSGSASVRKVYRRRLLDVNPFLWLSSRDRLKPVYVFLFLTGFGLFWLFFYWREGRSMLDQGTYFLTAILLHMAIKVWLCSESSRLLYEDKKTGALELTLSTPLSVKEILEGQFLGLLRQFGIGAALILLVDVVMMVAGGRKMQGADADWVVMCFAGILVLVMDLFTIPTLGMWLGLTSRRASRAAMLTGFYVLILPWLILFGFITFVTLVRFTGIDSLKFFVGAYFVVSLVIDLLFFLWASGNLTSRFRQVVTERFDAAKQ